MAKYIHSTASQNMVYPIYESGNSQNLAREVKRITIKGRANVVDPHTLVTPTGAVTEISDEDFELLIKNPSFQRHVKRCFMKVCDKQNLDTADMAPRDNCAQLKDAEYADGTDPRVPGSNMNWATCGRGDRIKGKKGTYFIDD